MKSIVTLIVLIFCAAASGQSFDAAIEHLQATKDAQRDELVATREQLQQANTKAAAAIEANIQQNAAFKDQIDAREKVIKKQAKTLGKWYVKLAILIAQWVFWIGIGLSVIYGTAFIGGFFAPHTIIFKIAQYLIREMPFMAWIDQWHPTTTVSATVMPVVEPPAVIAKPPIDPAMAANLAALAEATSSPAAKRTAVDYSTNLGWTQARPANP